MNIRGHRVLTFEHMMPCFKSACDRGFTMERNLRGCQMEGMIPFNRNALWRKRAEILLRASIGSSKTPSKQANPEITSALPPFASPEASPPLATHPAATAPDPTPENYESPLVLGHVTERVQKAMDHIKRKNEIVQLTQMHLMAPLIRLLEFSDIVTEIAATKAEKPKAYKQRITAKHLYGNKEVQRGRKADNF